MPKYYDTKRRTGKDKKKNTFNKYGKNTKRGMRHIQTIKNNNKNKQKNQN